MKNKLFVSALLSMAICLSCGCSEDKSIIYIDSGGESIPDSSSAVQSSSVSETPFISSTSSRSEPIESSSSDLPSESTSEPTSYPIDVESSSSVPSSQTPDPPPFSDPDVSSSSSAVPSSNNESSSSTTSSSSSSTLVQSSSSTTAQSSSSATSDPPEVVDPPEVEFTPIMGSSIATVEQMRKFIMKMNPDVADSVIEMIPFYLSEGEKEGVRGDIAFAQSCLETGYFRFEKTGTGSVVTIDQNNFCGMGVTSLGVKGESFDTPQIGIRAQIQHLKAYGSTLPLNGICVDNRFGYVTRGCARYVEWLGIKENPDGKGWAGGENYGFKIMNIYNNILSY